MAEHKKALQGGMAMMNGTSPGGAGGMKGDMAARRSMMDRLPAAPPK